MPSFVMRDTGSFIVYCLLYERFFFLCGRLIYINPGSWPVAGFCPHVKSTGVFGTYLNTLYPIFRSLKEVIAQRTRQSDYDALSLSLSHRSLTVGLLYSPWYFRERPDTVRVLDR